MDGSAAGRLSFDEAGFRSRYPEERFEEYRKEMRLPFPAYEEWLAALRRRAGMMSYLALARTDGTAAAVIGAAPVDLSAEIAGRPAMGALLERSIPGYSEQRAEALRARSALCWPEALPKRTPLLLLQGGGDDRTLPEGALRMALELHRLGRPFRLVFYESGGHGLTEHQEDVRSQTLLWFSRYLSR